MARAARRPIDRTKLLISGGFALGFVLVIAGLLTATTGRSALGLPPEVEQVSPGKGDSVLRQSEVMADLAPGYTGELVIDGRSLPVVEIGTTLVDPGQVASQDVEIPLSTRFDSGSNVLRYLPQEGAPIERLDPGPHEVKVVYWPIDEGRAGALSYTWDFNVSS